jgi:autotransporter-associated beta strand protein
MRDRLRERRAVFATATRFLAAMAAFAIVLLAGEAAWAACAPVAGNNVTATCTGTTTNQGGGAPGTSAGTAGYGTGAETGVTVKVAGGAPNTVTGTISGILLGDATVTNNTGAGILGGQAGIQALTGFANVTNSGSITGTAFYGIYANTDATVINNAGAAIVGNQYGIVTVTGFVNVTNSGTITGTANSGIWADTNATVINNAGASITGGSTGILAAAGFANVANSGSITGDRGIIAATNVTVTNNAGASIAGTTYGIFADAGGSSVFNAGTISGGSEAIHFTGGGNMLTLAQGSAISGLVLGTGSDTFQLGGAGAATFDVSALGPAAQYQGFGTFNKIGSSIWTLTGTSTFAGPVNVNAGTLLVNGNMSSASTMMVNAGGTLGGSGIVGNTTINGGTLAPGSAADAFGPLTVQGNLSFTAASTYMIQISSVNAGLTNVSGTAALAGTVQVTSPTNSFRFNSPYTILTSAGLGGTQFNSLNLTAPTGIAGSLIYSGNNVLLNLTSGLGQLPGLNINQHNVATVLDAGFNAPGSTQTGALGAIFTGNVPLNLTQASGETATGSQQTTFDAMNLFLGVLTDPFIAGRGDGASAAAGATPFAEEDDSASAYAAGGKPRSKSERDAYAAIYRKAPTAEPFAQRWSVWAAGFGGSQTTDGNTTLGSNTVTSRIAGGAVGADYRFSPFTLAGFALAGGGTNFSLANGLGTGRSDLFQAGAFVRHTMGPAYISAALAYGWQDITTDRTVTIAGVDRLHAEFNANAFSGRIEGGYHYVTPWIGGVGITPYAAGQFTTFDLPAYAEQALSGANTFALAYGSKSVTDPRSELGIRTDKSFAMQDAILTLRGRAAWAHDFNADRNIAATFQTLPGASFVVNGAAQAHDSALTTASIEMKWINGWSAAATFEGEFSEVTRSYAGKGVVRYAW